MPIERRVVSTNRLDIHNKYTELVIKVDGSAVTTTTSATGLVIGSKFCKVKDATEVVTITFNEALPIAPLVFTECATADCIVKPDSLVTTTTTIVYSCINISDGSTAVSDADITLLLRIPEGYEVV